LVQPVTEMCRTAWRFLQQRLENPSLPLQQSVLDTQLAIRESTIRTA